MSKNRLVSAKEVLARTIRALGYKLPSDKMDDCLEWLAEGLNMIRVTNALITSSTGAENCLGEVLVKNHCADLPCGFIYMIAVEDNCGRRLPEGANQTDITLQTNRMSRNESESRVSVFEVNPFVHQTSDGLPTDEAGARPPFYLTGEDLEPQTTSQHKKGYYKLQGNKIQTSFEEGFIRLHYWSLPVDKEGYPLIPDNEAYKQALEWHLIRRLIGSGYEHKVFSYQYANEQFEFYAARGINEVSFPTPETVARINRVNVRLFQPYEFYEDFFTNSEQPERLFK